MFITTQNIELSGLAGLFSSAPDMSSGPVGTSDFTRLIMNILGNGDKPVTDVCPVLTEKTANPHKSLEILSGIESIQIIDAQLVISTGSGEKISIPVTLLNDGEHESYEGLYDILAASLTLQTNFAGTQVDIKQSGNTDNTDSLTGSVLSGDDLVAAGTKGNEQSGNSEGMVVYEQSVNTEDMVAGQPAVNSDEEAEYSDNDTANATFYSNRAQSQSATDSNNEINAISSLSDETRTENSSAIGQITSDQSTVTTEQLPDTVVESETGTFSESGSDINTLGAGEPLISATTESVDTQQTENITSSGNTTAGPENTAGTTQLTETRITQNTADGITGRSENIFLNVRFADISDTSSLHIAAGDAQTTKVTLLISQVSDETIVADQTLPEPNQAVETGTQPIVTDMTADGLFQESTPQSINYVKLSTSAGNIPVVISVSDSSLQNPAVADLLNDLLAAGADVELVLEANIKTVSSESQTTDQVTVRGEDGNDFSVKTNGTSIIAQNTGNNDTAQTSDLQSNNRIIHTIPGAQEISNTDGQETGQQVIIKDQNVPEQSGETVSVEAANTIEETVNTELITSDNRILENIPQYRQSGGVGAGSNPTDAQRTFTRTPVKPPDAVINTSDSVNVSETWESESSAVETAAADIPSDIGVQQYLSNDIPLDGKINIDSNNEGTAKVSVVDNTSDTVPNKEISQQSTTTESKSETSGATIDTDMTAGNTIREENSVTVTADTSADDVQQATETSGKEAPTIVTRFSRTGSEHLFYEAGSENEYTGQFRISTSPSEVSGNSTEKAVTIDTTSDTSDIDTQTQKIKQGKPSAAGIVTNETNHNESVPSGDFIVSEDVDAASAPIKKPVAEVDGKENLKTVLNDNKSEDGSTTSVDKPAGNIYKATPLVSGRNTDVTGQTESSEVKTTVTAKTADGVGNETLSATTTDTSLTEQPKSAQTGSADSSKSTGNSDIKKSEPLRYNTAVIKENDSEDSGKLSVQTEVKTGKKTDETADLKVVTDTSPDTDKVTAEPVKKHDSRIQADFTKERKTNEATASNQSSDRLTETKNKSGTVRSETHTLTVSSDNNTAESSDSVRKYSEHVTASPDADKARNLSENKSHRVVSETGSNGIILAADDIGDISNGSNQYGSSGSEFMAGQQNGFETSGFINNSVTDDMDFATVQKNILEDSGEGDTDIYAVHTGESESVSKSDKIFTGRDIIRNADTGIADTTKNEVLNSIVKNARFLLNNGQSSAEISLEPPSLGKLKLEIVTENSKITGKITVESVETKEIVQNNIAELKEQLTQNGLKVESFDVQLGHNSGTDSWANREKTESLTQQLRRNISKNEKISSEIISGIQAGGRGKSVDSSYIDILM